MYNSQRKKYTREDGTVYNSWGGLTISVKTNQGYVSSYVMHLDPPLSNINNQLPDHLFIKCEPNAKLDIQKSICIT